VLGKEAGEMSGHAKVQRVANRCDRNVALQQKMKRRFHPNGVNQQLRRKAKMGTKPAICMIGAQAKNENLIRPPSSYISQIAGKPLALPIQNAAPVNSIRQKGNSANISVTGHDLPSSNNSM
jgi:hypothetical protein